MSETQTTRATQRKPKPRGAHRHSIGTVQPPLLADAADALEIVEGFAINVNGLTVRGRPPFAAWERVTETLRVAERGMPFAIGDLMLQAEAHLGEESSQLLDATDWQRKTVEVYRWLAQRIAPERRRMDRLSIRHHLAVASLTAAAQKKWLDLAAAKDDEEPWTVRKLTAALVEGEDVPASAWWVLVSCKDADDQVTLVGQMELQGRSCKAETKFSRRKKGDKK